MKSYRAYGDGAYLTKADVTPPWTGTINSVEERLVAAPGQQAKPKLVLFFNGTKKGLILNRSNGDVLFELTGTDDAEEWIGETVELFVDPSVTYAGKRVGGVRLRKPTAQE